MMTPAAQHYIDRLIALMQVRPPERGEVMHVNIEHDADCPLPDGTGPCICTPNITFTRKSPQCR